MEVHLLAPTLGPAPIEGILLVDLMDGPPLGQPFASSSLPGHLLHYVVEGEVRLQSNGRTYDLKPGKVLWYHEDEWVTGATTAPPWRFYTVNFIAPSLPPPSYEARLFTPVQPGIERAFAALFEAWKQEEDAPGSRLISAHARLLHILELLAVPALPQLAQADEAGLWWELEVEARRDLSRPINLHLLEQWAGCSAATIARASGAAVGQSPMRRIKSIRLSFARGLVQRSGLSFSEIAERIGYPRLHEFSRDYKAAYGASPSNDPTRLVKKPGAARGKHKLGDTTEAP